MLLDLPIAAVRYAALLNKAFYDFTRDPAGVDEPRSPWIDWIRHDDGIYEERGFRDLPWLLQWPTMDALYAIEDVGLRIRTAMSAPHDYGSADTVEQVLELYPYLRESEGKYLLSFNVLTPETAAGWRWHKNGPYIGTREPQAEHLGDEPEIDRIITWDVWSHVNEPDLDKDVRWRSEVKDYLLARMRGEQATLLT